MSPEVDYGPPARSKGGGYPLFGVPSRPGRSLDAASVELGKAEPNFLERAVDRILDGVDWILGKNIQIDLDLTKNTHDDQFNRLH